MRTIIIGILVSLLAACGQTPQSAVEPSKPVVPDVWVGCWEPYVLTLPNDCNDTESYCVVDGEAYKYSDRTKTKITPDSCQYRVLEQMGAFKCHGWGC
jgi:hypothetical protein